MNTVAAEPNARTRVSKTKTDDTPMPKGATLEPRTDARGRTYWRGKITLADGARVGLSVPEEKRCAKQACKDFVGHAQEKEDRDHTIYNAKIAGKKERDATTAAAGGGTWDAWYERFKTFRAKEVGTVDDDAWRWTKWISKAPVRNGTKRFGELAVREATADDVEDVRNHLTNAVLAYEAAGNTKGEGRLAPKTAQNVWAALTTPMKYASPRKGPRELRVREDLGNPCVGIQPPRDGASKRRHWLRPTQWSKLIAWLAPRDRAWAEAYAIGLYLHLRPGELHELRVKDRALADGEVRISRAFNERTKTITTPKTDEGIRTVSVPPTLMPLLERIARERGPEDRVCPIVAATPEKNRAGIYRELLEAASIDEPAFFVETATHLMIDFRSIRDTGITWRFLAGERAEVVQREAGHAHISTTLGYAKEVQDRRGRYGEPFPALPPELVPPPSDDDPSGGSVPSSVPRDALAKSQQVRLAPHPPRMGVRLTKCLFFRAKRSRTLRSNPASPTSSYES